MESATDPSGYTCECPAGYYGDECDATECGDWVVAGGEECDTGPDDIPMSGE